MISCYEKSLFEQQTPYLQWLREREGRKQVGEVDIKGKQIRKLPFFSCEESVTACLESVDICGDEGMKLLQGTDFVLFYGVSGFADAVTEVTFAEYFATHADISVVYADEDFLGSLQELYGDEVIESEYARSYCFKDTGLYRGAPWFKPDYSPDTLRSFFYIGNIFAVRGSALAEALIRWKQANGKEQECSIYELVLLITERERKAGHIAEVLYTNKNLGEKHDEIHLQDSTVKISSGTKDSLKNEIWVANVDANKKIQTLCYSICDNSLISVIIPSKDHSRILKRCLSTLTELTDYPHYEIIIVDNGSSQEERMCIKECISNVPVPVEYIYHKAEFNFSAMCNLGARAAKGDYLLFLNDDMEIIEPDWMRRMLGQAGLSHVGAVGAKLYYPKGEQEKDAPYRIQHAGITNMGIGPAHKLAGMEDVGNLYHGHNLAVYNMLAVTAACLMVKKERFLEAGGFDETLAVAYNDVELCFRLYEKGYYNVQRNDVVLLHHESLSRGQDTSQEKAARLEREKRLLYEKHPQLCGRDPFYSEHLVQWKKDVDYSCNYLYPCDKVVKPVLLEHSQARSLPKEHRNKFIKKLTGENLSMLQIDTAEISASDGTLFLQGWYVMRERDNALIEKRMLLKNTQTQDTYELAVYPKLRPDVEALFAGESGGATKRVALSGLQVLADTSVLTAGNYQVGIITMEKNSLLKKKICWKKDCFTVVRR